MNNEVLHLLNVLEKYKPKNLSIYNSYTLPKLRDDLEKWANVYLINIVQSGSYAKGTAIHLSSDVDFLISLKNECPETLESCYNSLYAFLKKVYPHIRKQNVSIRIKISSLEIDVTPAKKLPGHTNDHFLYVSKLNSRRQTNIQKHINDISHSGRLDEIKILKIWRELHGLDFPSIYLEYLIVTKILAYKPKSTAYLASNVIEIFHQLSLNNYNPLFSQLIDPANSNNVLSDLLSNSEKNNIINKARLAMQAKTWNQIVW